MIPVWMKSCTVVADVIIPKAENHKVCFPGLLTCSRESEHQRMCQPHAGFRQLEIRHHDAGQRSAAAWPQHCAPRLWQVRFSVLGPFLSLLRHSYISLGVRALRVSQNVKNNCNIKRSALIWAGLQRYRKYIFLYLYLFSSKCDHNYFFKLTFGIQYDFKVATEAMNSSGPSSYMD